MRDQFPEVYQLIMAHALQRPPAIDAAIFQRAARLPGLLGGMTAIGFLLYRSAEPRTPSVKHFLFETAPVLLQQFNHVSQARRVTLHGHARGRIDWAGTYKARYAQDASPALFVCLPSWRGFDLPENQLFKYMLQAVQHCLDRIEPSVRSWHAWGAAVQQAAAPQPIGAELAALAHRVRIYSTHIHLRDIEVPPAISGHHLLAARTSKNELYTQVADLYDLYHAIVEAPDRAQWQTIIGAVLPLLPPSADDFGRLLVT
jgi:hypothetical protein